ncbi:hypothetical protein QO179_24135 [Bacillus stercoris]|nr:hypothetical protein [Bacillus stercoris]
MEDLKLDGAINKVAFLLDNIPQARDNYLYLLLSYWQIFDDIDIPEEVVSQIVEKATQPETIGRSRRKAMELARYREILELQRLVKEMGEVEVPHTL